MSVDEVISLSREVIMRKLNNLEEEVSDYPMYCLVPLPWEV